VVLIRAVVPFGVVAVGIGKVDVDVVARPMLMIATLFVGEVDPANGETWDLDGIVNGIVNRIVNEVGRLTMMIATRSAGGVDRATGGTWDLDGMSGPMPMILGSDPRAELGAARLVARPPRHSLMFPPRVYLTASPTKL
jgi:hypothetical protein